MWCTSVSVILRRRSSSGFAALCSFLDQNSQLTVFCLEVNFQRSRVWCIAVYCLSHDCSPSAPPLVSTSPWHFLFLLVKWWALMINIWNMNIHPVFKSEPCCTVKREQTMNINQILFQLAKGKGEFHFSQTQQQM